MDAMIGATRGGAILALLTALAAPAAGRAQDSATIIARGRFEQGRLYFQMGDYQRALVEFEAARGIKPLPGFDFNIGLCHERLRQIEPAVTAYRRYLDSLPEPPDAREVRAHVALLEASAHRSSEAQAAQAAIERALPAPPAALAEPLPKARSVDPSATRWVAPGVFAALAALSLVTGGALAGGAAAEYDADNQPKPPDGAGCRPCNPALVDGLRMRYEAGWGLIGVGAAVALIDVVLWIAARSRPRPIAASR
jgi:tetratricopeptide (TPR) repeat protein